MITNTVTDQLNKRLNAYKAAIENRSIDYASFIVEVGALTVGTDEEGKIIPQNVLYPTQFSQAAIEVIESMNWKDGNGKSITPIVFFKNDWYREKIRIVQETLSLLN